MADDCAKITFCFYSTLTLLLALTSLSWMVHVNRTGNWRNEINSITTGEINVPRILERSWNMKPFTDVIFV